MNQLRDVLQKVRPKVLGIVHAETSTGAWQPMAELGKLCHEHDTLLFDLSKNRVETRIASPCATQRLCQFELFV